MQKLTNRIDVIEQDVPKLFNEIDEKMNELNE